MKTLLFLIFFSVCFSLAGKPPRKGKGKHTTVTAASPAHKNDRLSYWIKQTGNDTVVISKNSFRKNEEEPVENATRKKMNQQTNPESQSPYESIFGDILYNLFRK